MSVSPEIPNDENGDVLRRMLRDGDDLSQPPMMDFSYIFPERRQALAFAEMLMTESLRFAFPTTKNAPCGTPS
jgi:hypothetical protein